MRDDSRRRVLGRLAALGVAASVLLSACGGGPILANEALVFPTPPVPSAAPSPPPDPIPVELPRDDGPHDRLTEWWYYTGHLRTVPDGRRYGFEAVVFRAERGGIPVAWASHLALTDEEGQQFTYAQRSEIGPQVDRSPRDATGIPTGFDLQVAGLSPDLVAAGASPFAPPWRLSGSNGTDRVEAALSPAEAAAAGRSFGLALDLRSTKPAALHGGNGFIDFFDAGSSYYYSRTRMAASGTLTIDGSPVQVEGIAWFDHQWGDFISVGGGGWNWFAINLTDGTDITISDVLDEGGRTILAYGTSVDPEGVARPIRPTDILNLSNVGFGTWQSPATGRDWARQWDISIVAYDLHLTATVPGQELDTRATTGVVYWEGSHLVTGTHDPDPSRGLFRGTVPVGGDAYVEMTRYDAIGP
jgi:predicted secreted hydrolase